MKTPYRLLLIPPIALTEQRNQHFQALDRPIVYAISDNNSGESLINTLYTTNRFYATPPAKWCEIQRFSGQLRDFQDICGVILRLYYKGNL